VTALITVISFGILYILGLPSVGVIPEEPGTVWGVILAVVKVDTLALMTFFAMMLHRAAEVQKEQREDEWERKRKEVDLQLYAAEQKALAKMRLREVSQNSVTPPVSRGVTPHSDAERARLRDAIVTVYRDTQGEVNVTREAAALGISRGLWYKLKDEAAQRGEL
jgi:hypothetical protein